MFVGPLRISTAQIGNDAWVVSAAGEIDLHTAPPFGDKLNGALEGGARRVIIDLAAVAFLDSAGLGVLTRVAKRLRARDGECVLVSDDPRITRVFEITGLDRFFTIERSLAEAVERLVDGVPSR